MFITPEVIEATCRCLLAKAEDAEEVQHSDSICHFLCTWTDCVFVFELEYDSSKCRTSGFARVWTLSNTDHTGS